MIITEEIRKIEDELSKHEGPRLKPNKESLEKLLFYEAGIGGNKVKKIFYRSKFFNKMDLSEISFDGVDPDFYHPDYGMVDFSDTNINLDFTKMKGNVLASVIFRNVDLSKSGIEKMKRIEEVILNNTGIDLTKFDNTLFQNVYLDNNDLSNIEFTLKKYRDKYYLTDGKNRYNNVSLYNTGAIINIKNHKVEDLVNASAGGILCDFEGCIIKSNKPIYVDEEKNKIKTIKL